MNTEKKQTWHKINPAEWPEIKRAKFSPTWAPKMYGASIKDKSGAALSIMYDGWTKEFFIFC